MDARSIGGFPGQHREALERVMREALLKMQQPAEVVAAAEEAKELRITADTAKNDSEIRLILGKINDAFQKKTVAKTFEIQIEDENSIKEKIVITLEVDPAEEKNIAAKPNQQILCLVAKTRMNCNYFRSTEKGDFEQVDTSNYDLLQSQVNRFVAVHNEAFGPGATPNKVLVRSLEDVIESARGRLAFSMELRPSHGWPNIFVVHQANPKP